MSNEEQKLVTLPTGEVAVQITVQSMVNQLHGFIDYVGALLDKGRYARGQRRKKPRGAKAKRFSRMCWESYIDAIRKLRIATAANLEEIKRRNEARRDADNG